MTLQDYVDATRRQGIERASPDNAGNMTHAAAALGLGRAGLYKPLVRLGMHEQSKRSGG